MQCFVEIIAECEAAWPYAAALPMCRADWSQGPGVLRNNPVVFIEVIKASAVKCRHPYTFTIAEQADFLGATVLGEFKDEFMKNKITGARMTEITLHQLLTVIGVPLGDALDFMEGKNLFLRPTPPVNVGMREGKDVPTVQLTFNVKAVSEIDAVKFEFQAVLDIVMHWSDQNIWAECKANGDFIEQGRCQYVWKPKLLFPNARHIEIPTSRQYLWWGPVPPLR